MKLAQCFDGEIVNFDSIQVYRELNIGSAKPTAAERGGVPHHLLDILQVTEELTAGEFANRARETLRAIASRQRVPILAGGSGFYLRALLDGLSPAPLRDKNLRIELAQRPSAALHRFLRRCDPEAASRIHPRDAQKLIRAIEMTVLAGRPATKTQAAPRQALDGYSVVKIGLAPERAALCERLNERTARMFECGLLEEAASLLAAGIPAETKALQSLGYKQALAHLSGKMDLAAAVELCQARTRQYAKRQMTWFRAEKDVFWLTGFGGDPEIQRLAIAHVAQLLTPQIPC